MNKLFAILLIVPLLFTACKKKEQPTTTNNSNSGNNNGNTNNATSWYGILTCEKQVTEYNGTLISPNYSYRAFFANSPVPAISPSYSVAVDSVKGNNLTLYSGSLEYTTNAYGTITPVTWQVWGNNGIPSFSYTNNDSIPTFTGYTQLPDTISKSASITVPINGIANYSKVTVSFYDGLHFVSQVLASGQNQVTFSTSSLAALDTTSYGNLWVDLEKNNVQSISSKDFNFVSTYQFLKYIKIKN